MNPNVGIGTRAMFYTALLGSVLVNPVAASRAPSPIRWEAWLPLVGGVAVLAVLFAWDVWPGWRSLMLALLLAHGMNLYTSWDITADVFGRTSNPTYLLAAGAGVVGMLSGNRRQWPEDLESFDSAAVIVSLGVTAAVALLIAVLARRDLVALGDDFLIAAKILVSLLFVCGVTHGVDSRKSGLAVSILSLCAFLLAVYRSP